ncbi:MULTISPECIES: DUF6230 family protein [Streptomyces]|uniref:Cholesterol esterase n=1 Tax=Streptomyces thermoviolaceus subsp. thermoviolaceus TaxID=66860 RepID=A0ABX0YPK3_STRTL|nr:MULTISPECIES: DUF6230 family protein [Streptomyces]MCM3263386.1 DUF6230 family protein [Streptomyces thermoviolaceus]NJP13251.1 cholesterol esterase [Streptomyces thermoviolaceus subsp. thermoviolaceus]RSS09028.1 cholesterol esterase [Streptomyces sp. WAC00469]WTD46917.1 DUF6230 family protein [Streptomyces thermoviolaceus]GGV71759.1 hypothetical protein GCM10010499_22910 [Streptomyces thermoviolaceus subsp. apingens]
MASSSDLPPSADHTPDHPHSAAAGDTSATASPPAAGRTERRGRVRLRRAAVMAVPATLAAAGLAVLTAEGALGVQFAISGMPFTVTASELNGTGFEQFGSLDTMAEDSPNAGDTGGQVLVVTSAIKNATLTKLCQSVDLGGTNLLITAGGGAKKVQATDLTTDSTELSGDAAFDNIEIGNDASTLTKAGVQGPKGVFSQQADTVHIANLRQTNYATTAGVFKLPGLRLRFSDTGC